MAEQAWIVKLARKAAELEAELEGREELAPEGEIAEELLEAQDALLQVACSMQALKIGHYMEEEEELDFRQEIENS